MPLSSRTVVRFGPFEVDLEECTLRKNGLRIRLQAQPFQILAALLERPGIAVTRDELRQRLWPQGTFVDFEHGLNTAVTRLRRALGDVADKPRYIETLQRRGYRFIGSPERGTGESQAGAPASPAVALKRRPAMWIAAIVLLVAAVGAVGLSTVSRGPMPKSGRPVPLTAFRGREAHPALSPDGTHVAFTWTGETQDNFDIYVMRIGSGSPLRLTRNPADEVSPAWSPDGRTIAFLRRLGGDRGELVVVPATGGPEHRVHAIRDVELRTPPGRLLSLAWSPDGSWIAAAHSEPEDMSGRIYLFSPAGEMRPLTSSPPGLTGDHAPAFAPDAHALAFCRLPGFSTSEVYVLPLASNFQPQGAERRLTTGKRWSVSPIWIHGGRSVAYLRAEEPHGRHHLRIVAASGSKGSDKDIPLDDEPMEIHAGQHLVYSHWVHDTNIWRAKIAPVGQSLAPVELFLSSTRRDEKPRYSPDGAKIAFVSSRSGFPEIWVSKADGSHPVRITSFDGPLVGYMNWSPDGQWLVFHARPEGQADVFVIPAAGGSAKRLTSNSVDDTMPVYSPDGRWIYFASARSGTLQIWRMTVAGGEPLQLTTSGGLTPAISRDGKTVFYMALDGTEVWSIPAQGGEPVKVVGPTHAYPSGFAVTAEGLYYTAPPHSGEQSFIRFFSFSTAQSMPVAVVSRPVYLGMSVSPDSKYILVDELDESGSDLMLVENFRFP